MGLLVVILGLFAWDRLRYDVVAIGGLLLAVSLQLVPIDLAFSGFAHPAVITVAMVLVLSRGLINSGFVDGLSRKMSVFKGKGYLGFYVLLVATALTSALINNVGALALFMPLAIKLARQNHHSPSLYLMPLAFASLLGGMMTLVGTPPNIILATFRSDFGEGAPFRFFDFTLVGGMVTILGLAAMMILAKVLVPQRISEHDDEDLFDINNYVMEFKVVEDSKWVGERLSRLSELTDELIVIALIRGDERMDNPRFSRVFREGDKIIVRASVDSAQELTDRSGFRLSGSDKLKQDLLQDDTISTSEVLITKRSAFEGKTVVDLNLRFVYGVNVLGISREGDRIRGSLKNIRFKAGDVVLLQGRSEALKQIIKNYTLYPLLERDLRIGNLSNILGASVIFLLAILLTVFGVFPAPLAFMMGALLMVFFKFVPTKELYSSIDFSIVVLLGALIPISLAFESTGTAGLLAGRLEGLSQGLPVWLLLVFVMVITMGLSNIINNAAAALIMAPIAFTLALQLGVNTDTFLMAVAVAASSAFLTPIGHQSNTLVMGPGGYQFKDYLRLGIPLSLVVLVGGLLALLWVWPL